jgi:hypothetical protein
MSCQPSVDHSSQRPRPSIRSLMAEDTRQVARAGTGCVAVVVVIPFQHASGISCLGRRPRPLKRPTSAGRCVSQRITSGARMNGCSEVRIEPALVSEFGQPPQGRAPGRGSGNAPAEDVLEFVPNPCSACRLWPGDHAPRTLAAIGCPASLRRGNAAPALPDARAAYIQVRPSAKP